MVHDPLSPSEALRTRVGTVLAAVSLFALVYGVLIVAELLLSVLIAGSLTIGAYLWYRTFAVLDSIADAAQRFAEATEREAGTESGGRGARGARSARDDDARNASAGVGSTRPTERER
ncbi:hypothetical protein ACFPM1_06930 [Halorubrum rubrum]|uniref:Uncharacterized protein n=1 Tax=Halorubrum rubrum TaxID=1126240 RepID=A0ABD5R0T6_9EURY|nr:hypothetical protein [Halorubrum rubrum]